MIVPQESQNQAIDAQRSQVLSLLGEEFDVAWTGNVTLAATQHHANRYANAFANFLNRFEIGSEPTQFEMAHNLQPPGSPSLRFQSVFEGRHDHFQQAVVGLCIWSVIAHSSFNNKKASLARRLFVGQLI